MRVVNKLNVEGSDGDDHGHMIEDNLNKINLNETRKGRGDRAADVRVRSTRSVELIGRMMSLLVQLKGCVKATSREVLLADEDGRVVGQSRTAVAGFLPFAPKRLASRLMRSSGV